jgi:transcriptional regulator with XRE-family HTH domain
MSELIRLVDDYKDTHGQPSDASIARAIGIAPQTLNSWRKRGVKEPPAVDTLRRMARFFHISYEDVVLPAALVDAGWLDHMPTSNGHPPQSDTA